MSETPETIIERHKPRLVPTLDGEWGAPIGGYQIKIGDFVLATFHYDYRWTDNATVRRHAEVCFAALFPDAALAPRAA